MPLVAHNAGIVFDETGGESAVLRLMDNSSTHGCLLGVFSDFDISGPAHGALQFVLESESWCNTNLCKC